ncbi:unnamed protein product [Absidia cylindrospora]
MQIKGNTFIVTVLVDSAKVLSGTLSKLEAMSRTELAQSLGPSQVFVPGKVDVTSEVVVREAIQKTVEKFGKLAGVINCGGVATAAKVARRGKTAHTMTLDLFEFTVRVNLIGTFNVCRQVAQVLVNQDPFTEDGERGVIINTASIAYQDGQAGQVAYSASKGGVASFTLPLARDLAPAGVRVLAIAPGLFQTNMTAMVNEKVLKDAVFPNRMGKPHEFANLVSTMIENGMLNGEVIRLDGATRLGKL